MLNTEALIPLVGPFKADQLFGLQDVFLLPPWLLLVFAPRWKHTHRLAWIPIFLFGILYVISAITQAITAGPPQEGGNFGTLEGVATLFQDPNTVYMGWIHYLSFDLFVGRCMSLDALEFNLVYWQHVLIMGPCLLFTFMLGPTGLVMYAILKYSLMEKLRVDVTDKKD